MIVISLLIFAIVLVRVFIRSGDFVGAVLAPIGALVLALLCTRLILKQVVLYSEYLAICRSLPSSKLYLPYRNIEHAEYFPHVFRSGPALIMRYRAENTTLRRIRVSLNCDSEFFIAKLQEAGVDVKVH